MDVSIDCGSLRNRRASKHSYTIYRCGHGGSNNKLGNTQDMKKGMKKVLLFSLLGLVLVGAGCTDADIASSNLSKAADQFEIQRRIVFYNGITSEYMLTIEGRCSLGNYDPSDQLTVTCKTSNYQYKKHFLGLSDNVTYFVEQMDATNVSEYHYRVIFKPAAIVPDIDLE